MKTNILKITAILLISAGIFSSCAKKEKGDTPIYGTTGTVIGSYYDVCTFSLLVQVDKQYPIGETLVYSQQECIMMPGTGTYQNMIQVQEYNMPEIMNKKISFSYRTYQPEEDGVLFATDRPCLGLCGPPAIPMYVITDCQIL